MLGSAFDAEDAVQETMVRAWQNLNRFEGRSSLRTWLYRIATNVCLDALASRSRRVLSMDERGAGTLDETLDVKPRTHWLEPIPDVRAIPADGDPHEIATLRQSIRLAFVAALQHLPARQRAALLLTEVLGWSAAEVAECLETSVAAVNSALQRARATLAANGKAQQGRAVGELTAAQKALIEQFLDAFQRYDVDEIVGLLRDDAALSMPPFSFWLQGQEDIRGWLVGRGNGCRGSRLIATQASGLPAFGQYRPGDEPGTWKPWGLIVLEPDGDRIASWTSFLDTENLFPLFGLPPAITDR
ncbi:MAG: sigma-70 family RNA polymerase sigma factor [Vicinamibacterales bacterium]